MSGADELRGVLSRRGGFFASWTKFTYAIKDHYLIEYKLGSNPLSSEPLQMLDLTDSLLEDAALITGKAPSFVLHCATGKSYFFLAPSIQEKTKWMQAIQARNPSIQQQQQQQQQQQAKSLNFPASPQPNTLASPQPNTVASSSPSTPSSVKNSSASQKDNTSFSNLSNTSVDSLSPMDLESKIPILKYLESFTDAVVVGNIK